MIQPGKYEAKIANYGYSETKNGDPKFEILFEIEGQGSVKWSGVLKGNATKITLGALETCGLTGSLHAVAEGPTGGALDMDRKVMVTVEHEQDQKDPTKKWARVKWVNPLQSTKFDAALAHGAKAKLASLEGEWSAHKAERGIKPKSQVPF